MFNYVHSSIVCNSQSLETAQMPLNKRLDKESVAHLHIRVHYISVVKNNDILNFACKWMKLENTILSEETQTQKNEYGMYSLVSRY